MKFGIDKFSGIWTSKDNYKLEIKKIDDSSALVSFYALENKPIKRPYFNNEPTLNMSSVYDDYSGEFSVDLWEHGKGFELDLNYEETYVLDKLQRESLIPSLTRYEDDNFLDQYYGLFGNLNHFTKIFTVK